MILVTAKQFSALSIWDVFSLRVFITRVFDVCLPELLIVSLVYDDQEPRFSFPMIRKSVVDSMEKYLSTWHG